MTQSPHELDPVIVTGLDKEFSPYRDLFELRDSAEYKGGKLFNFHSNDGHFGVG